MIQTLISIVTIRLDCHLELGCLNIPLVLYRLQLDNSNKDKLVVS